MTNGTQGGGIVKKHIVFIVERYTPEYSANVNCVRNIIHELGQQNVKISVVCASHEATGLDTVDGVMVHRIKYVNYASRLSACRSKFKKRLLILCHFVKSVVLLPWYPNVTPFITNKVYKKLLDIQKNEQIDCVIGVFQPYFPIRSALKLKNKFKTIPVIGYYLDVMKGANKPFGTTQRFFEILCDKSQKKDFAKLNKVFLPECSKVYYDIDYFSEYHEKIKYINFPTLLKEYFTGENDSSTLNMVYAGTTNHVYRNPVRAIDLLIKAHEYYPNIVLHLYGDSDMKDELKQLEMKSNGAFIYHGIVQKAVADIAIQQADYCVNFGNNVCGMVPSKIFELIATGKSILHFTSGSGDSSLEYLQKYPKAKIIDYQNSDQEMLLDLLNVLKDKRIHVDYDSIERIFYTATPRAVSDEMMKIVEK